MKAQSSIEFVILVGFMSVVFITFFIAIQGSILDTRQKQLSLAMEQLEQQVVSEIEFADNLDGLYTRTFIIPEFLNGQNYTITLVDSKDLVIQSRGTQRVYFLDTPLYGNITKGPNTITKFGSKVLFNVDVSAAQNVIIDGNDNEWIPRVHAGDTGIMENFQENNDAVDIFADRTESSPSDSADIVRILYAQDEEKLYFYIEHKRVAYASQGSTEKYNVFMLLDADGNELTGYRNTGTGVMRFRTNIGADYLIALDEMNISLYVPKDGVQSDYAVERPGIYAFDNEENDFDPQFQVDKPLLYKDIVHGSSIPPFEMERIDNTKVEFAVPKYLFSKPFVLVQVHGEIIGTTSIPQVQVDYVPGFEAQHQGQGFTIYLT